MTLDEHKAVAIISGLYNQLDKQQQQKSLSVEEFIALELLKNAVSVVFSQMDEALGNKGLKEALKDTGAHPITEGTVNHVILDKPTILLLAETMSKIIDSDELHFIDSGGELSYLAKAANGATVQMIKLPSLTLKNK